MNDMDRVFYTASEEPCEPPVITQVQADPREVRRHFSMIGWGYTVLLLGMMALTSIIQLVVIELWPWLFEAWWMSWFLSLVPLYGIGLPLLWLILRQVDTAPHNPLCVDTYAVTQKKPPFTIGKWILLLVIGQGCMYVGSFAGTITMNILSEITGYDYANGLNSLMSGSPLWMIFLATCIIAPLGEELLFRKLLIDRTRRYGDATAILLSGLMFGLFHGNLFQFFYAFLLGMILAYMYTRTDNLWWCVAMHAVINLLGSIVIPAIGSVIPTDGSEITSVWPILATFFLLAWQFGFIIVGVVLFCVFWHRRRLSPAAVALPGRGVAPVILNVGMIVCLACMIGITVLGLIPR